MTRRVHPAHARGEEPLVHLGGPRVRPSRSVATGPVGRLSSYSLRVSLLEQCNLACPYCMPGAVVPPTEKRRWLRGKDYRLLAPLFAERGVTKVRLTGGEPLLRDDAEEIIAAFVEGMGSTLDEGQGRPDLALTTNGTRLAKRAASLRDAGLTRVTVHLDTLHKDRYQELMGAGDPGEILDGIDAARALFDEVKLNVVLQRGKNMDELGAFLELSKEKGVEVRFIELMNTGSAKDYVDDVFVTGREIVEAIGEIGGVTPIDRRHPSDPAALFRTGDDVVFGVIASDTDPFCADCNRLRLTADGRLRGCLYEAGGVPLGAALGADADARAIGALMDAALDDKRSFHPLVAPRRVPFSMADIGG